MGDDLFCVLAGALPHLGSSLKFLLVQDNDLGDAGLGALAAILPQLPLVESLDLRGNRCGDDQLIRLSQALSQLPVLRVFRTAPTAAIQFSATAMSALASSLSSPAIAASLHLVSINRVKSIVSMLPRPEKLESLTLFVDLDLHDIEIISTVCTERKCLNSLSIDLNNLGDDGIRTLVPAIAANQQSLEMSGLHRGGTTAVGCQLLGSLLASDGFSPLWNLCLMFSDLSTSITAFATDILKHLPSLESLTLVGNRIGDNGAAALASSLHSAAGLVL